MLSLVRVQFMGFCLVCSFVAGRVFYSVHSLWLTKKNSTLFPMGQRVLSSSVHLPSYWVPILFNSVDKVVQWKSCFQKKTPLVITRQFEKKKRLFSRCGSSASLYARNYSVKRSLLDAGREGNALTSQSMLTAFYSAFWGFIQSNVKCTGAILASENSWLSGQFTCWTEQWTALHLVQTVISEGPFFWDNVMPLETVLRSAGSSIQLRRTRFLFIAFSCTIKVLFISVAVGWQIRIQTCTSLLP